VVLGEPRFGLGERGRRDRFGARRGESLFSLEQGKHAQENVLEGTIRDELRRANGSFSIQGFRDAPPGAYAHHLVDLAQEVSPISASPPF
jgi:hypothetical protein